MSARDLDVVVFGATGVTGRRVAGYLAERAQETSLRWAAAGRDAARLGERLAEGGVRAPETIIADVEDRKSLAALASRTQVVLDLVGPYTRYGRPVIEACVAGGAHYLDLSGELPFVRRIIDEFDQPAAQAGVKIVQVCGFEALPPDLAVLLAAEQARERWQEGLATVDLEVSFNPPPGMPRASDTMSGGTFQSIAAIAGDPDSGSVSDPGVLITDPESAAEVRRVSPITLAPRSGSHGAVIAPMTPAPFVNPAVIQRTAALTAQAGGNKLEPFRYREGLAIGGGAASLAARWAIAGALSGTQIGLRGLTRADPNIRRGFAGMLGRFGPPSGFGPSGARLENWRWRMSVSARTTGGHELEVRVDADGHPGYLATARLIGEAGMLLAEQDGSSARGGCLTPAIALGSVSLPRFERAGMSVSVSG